MDNELHEDICFELDLDPLTEDGFLSAMKRFIFFDQSALDEIRAALSEVRTEYDRQRLLRAIDGFLDEARKMKKSGFFGDALSGMFTALMAGWAGSAIGWAVGMSRKVTAPEAGAAKQAMRGLANAGRGLLGRAKADYAAADIASAQAALASDMAGAAFKTTAKVAAAIAALVIVLRMVNRNGDRIDDYINALSALRSEVESMKLPAAESSIELSGGLHEDLALVAWTLTDPEGEPV